MITFSVFNMALGEFKPPGAIDKDEDKYGKGRLSFTKIQILYAFIGLFFGFSIYLFLSLFPFRIFHIFGIVLSITLMVFGLLLGSVNIQDKKYLKGGGLRIDMYLIRLILKRFDKKRHVLYTRNIDRDHEKKEERKGLFNF